MRGLAEFVRQSNAIEGIIREPSDAEIEAHRAFLAGPPTVESLSELARALTHGVGRLRDRPGMDVRVGGYVPPRGGPHIVEALRAVLEIEGAPWRQHIAYETLHPFLDGNGRTGRALWLSQMGEVPTLPLGFLHRFYYQTLDAQGL